MYIEFKFHNDNEHISVHLSCKINEEDSYFGTKFQRLHKHAFRLQYILTLPVHHQSYIMCLIIDILVIYSI